MKTNIQDKQLDALFQKVLPPEEYGEDSNVEELYNRIMDLETELEKFKVSSHEPIQQGADSGQLQQHIVMESVCDYDLHNVQVRVIGKCKKCDGTIEQTAP